MRNFTATVKEREEGQPCFVVIEMTAEHGDAYPVLYLRDGTNFADAQTLARLLNGSVERVGRGLG